MRKAAKRRAVPQRQLTYSLGQLAYVYSGDVQATPTSIRCTNPYLLLICPSPRGHADDPGANFRSITYGRTCPIDDRQVTSRIAAAALSPPSFRSLLLLSISPLSFSPSPLRLVVERGWPGWGRAWPSMDVLYYTLILQLHSQQSPKVMRTDWISLFWSRISKAFLRSLLPPPPSEAPRPGQRNSTAGPTRATM